MILNPRGTGSDAEGPEGGSVLLGGLDAVSWVMTPVDSQGLVLMLIKAAFVACELEGLGVTALARTTIPLSRATKCSPEL